MTSDDLGTRIRALIDASPYMVSLKEISSKIDASDAHLLDAIERLCETGKLFRTADRSSRGYYVRLEQTR